MRRDAATAAVRTIAHCKDKHISRCLRLDSFELNLYRQSAKRSQETHDPYGTSGDDWMEAAPNVSANNGHPMRTAHEIDGAPRANLVHGATHNDHMACVEERDDHENEFPFGSASEL